MKKPVSILLAAVIAASALAAAPFAAHAAQYGDVDGDGLVTVVDATIIQKHSARLTTLDSSLLKAADMNGDGKVNVVDATNVQKVAAGIDEPAEIMPEVSDDDLKNEGSLAMNRFGVKLLQNSEIKDKNVLISPLSVMYALGMASNGAGGSTLHQMESTMGMSLDTMNRYFKAYPSYLSQDENAKLSIADSVWFNTLSQNIALRDSFTNAVRENYAAEVAALPFDHKAEDQINAWVNEKTGGMIPSVIKDIDPNTMMYLINALYFEADWAQQYQKYSIREGEFTNCDKTKSTVEFMYGEFARYIDDEKAKGFIQWFKGYDYFFVAMLPDEGVSVEEYAASLTAEKISSFFDNSQQKTVKTKLPKFEVKYNTELSQTLKDLGVKDAFNPYAANFRGMVTDDSAANPFIDKVIHKTAIKVDESGTKAGAVTAIEISPGAAPEIEEPKKVYLDRPFVYMLIERNTMTAVFIGTVNNL